LDQPRRGGNADWSRILAISAMQVCRQIAKNTDRA
jgi:hypothetical protein